MRLLKALIVIFITVLLTGCYTQLQYSQKMKKITDERGSSEYSWGGEEEAAGHEEIETQTPSGEYAEYQREGQASIPPFQYKDYEYEQRWDDCKCNPYTVNNYYGSYYEPYGYGGYYDSFYYPSHLSLSPFYYQRWHHYPYYGLRNRFYGSRFNFGFSFGWGSPFSHRFYNNYYDPFYYDPFGYGYGGYLSYNYYYFNDYYNDGYGGGKVVKDNRRYGPRSVGTSRVRTGDSGRRSRSATHSATGRRDARVKSSSTVRSRTGSADRTTRSRGTVGRTKSSSTGTRSSSTVRSRTRTDNGSSSNRSRTRSRGTVQTDRSDRSTPTRTRTRSRVGTDRSKSSAPTRSGNVERTRSSENDRSRSSMIRSRTPNTDRNLRQRLENRAEVERQLRSQRARKIDINNRQRNRTTFLDRVKKAIERSDFGSSTRSRSYGNTNTVRTRSSSTPSRSSSVGRSTRSSSKSSVTRNRSSSSSRSRGTSSRSSSSSRSRSSSSRSR